MAQKPLSEILRGQTRFHRLTAISLGGFYQQPKGKRVRLIVCECDCGTITSVAAARKPANIGRGLK